MKPRLTIVTLAVADLQKSLAFYRDGMGLPSKGIVGTEYKDQRTGASGTVAFFELKGGLMLALYERSNLERDSQVRAGPPSSLELSLGQLVDSRAAVDVLLEQAAAAGAQVTDTGHDRPWGIYSGYFKDLDGHLWEIFWDPRVKVED